MKFNRTNITIGTCFLALLILFAFQAKWMTDSRNLIEEQFNQKVNMAMCYAVDLLEPDKGLASCSSSATNSCSPVHEVANGFQLETKEDYDIIAIKSAIDIALSFYKINLEAEVDVISKDAFVIGNFSRKYTCSINPLEKNESNQLLVSFPDKEQYIFDKMKFMFFSSIAILFLITMTFILASYTMLRQKRMQQFNKEFFNNLAHEFRTPLTNISLAGALLSKNNKDPKEARYLKVVKEESKKLATQVDRILNLAKLENGEYQLDKTKLCLRDLIETVISDLDIQIKEKNASISFDIAKESVALEGDKFHLGNAFRNLLENALKYSKDAPQINISVKKNSENILIRFEDNGIGIAQKDQKDVFEKYHRVNHGNIHDQKGFGLGLAYVKMIVERHKGIIKIFSDLNKGTRFDLFLPAK